MKQRIGWKQRLLSAVLAVAMCVAMLPAQAVALSLIHISEPTRP